MGIQKIGDNIIVDIDAKNVTFKEYQVYKDKDEVGVKRLYLKISYSYEDNFENKKELVIPKIELPFRSDLLPLIVEEEASTLWQNHRRYFIKTRESGLECEKVEEVTVTGENGESVKCKNAAFVDVMQERAVKKMTLSEIEEKLGYKVELISEKEN